MERAHRKSRSENVPDPTMKKGQNNNIQVLLRVLVTSGHGLSLQS